MALEPLEFHLDMSEAQVVRSFLRAHGFLADAADEHLLSVHWLYFVTLGGIRIQIPGQMVEEARNLLSDIRAQPAFTQPRRRRPLKRTLVLAALVLLTGG
ncbi:MAG: hypothetical protein ISR44_07750 [Rhodospirillales bacterium]|nr:hypothetical protein [Rhodospirillales bacterium]